MLLSFYVLLLTITLIFLVVGFWADNPILSITGAGFLFILGYTLMVTGIEIKTGETITKDNITLTETVTNTYSTNTNHTIGFWLTFIGFVAIFLTLLDMWRAKQ
jgi:predicted tellurium resistance membrane protein TerC